MDGPVSFPEPAWTRNWKSHVAFDCVITGSFGEKRKGGDMHLGTDVSTAEHKEGKVMRRRFCL